MSGSETSKQIDARAAEFVIQADRGLLSDADQAALDAWLDEDIRHLGAYTRALAVFSQAKRAKALGPHFDPDTFHEHSDLENGETGEPGRRGAVDRRAFMRFGSLAAAASLVAAIVWQVLPSGGSSYQTRLGQIKTVILDDGSRVTLNTETKITVRFDDETRHVTLREGEAFFEVTDDAGRPFIVEAGRATAKVVGTKFSVLRLASEPVEVMVQEGSVEVGDVSTASAKPILVKANTRVIVPQRDSYMVQELSPADLDRRLTWRHGMLSFENTPLVQAVQAFSRYSRLDIQIRGSEIAAEPITGYFASDNPLIFAETVAEILHLQLRQSGNAIVLSK